MNREYLFFMFKKTSTVTLLLLMMLLVMERIIAPQQDIVNTARIILVTVFVLSTIALPWIKRGSLWVKALGLIGITLYILGFLVPNFSILVGIAILIGVLIFLMGGSFSGIKEETNKNKSICDEKDSLPLPGPTKRAGESKTLVKYLISILLAFFNPFQFIQMFIHIVGNLLSSELKDFKQKGTYTLPFMEEWIIINGGIDKKDSHSWDVINQRYAYDFVAADQKIRHINNGDNLRDYYCYGRKIISPADGQVIKVRDGIRDYPHPGTMTIDFLAKDFRGNFVIIKHEEKEYSVMAHFVPRSITVKEGDFVKRGQLIGECGNSGHSTEPHLHLHFQDHPNFYLGRGLPIKFSNLIIDGVYKKEAYVKKGQSILLSQPLTTDKMTFDSRVVESVGKDEVIYHE